MTAYQITVIRLLLAILLQLRLGRVENEAVASEIEDTVAVARRMIVIQSV